MTQGFWSMVRLSRCFMIFITAPPLSRHQTPTMTCRTLRDMTYSEAVPTFGRCTVCGPTFHDTSFSSGRSPESDVGFLQCVRSPRMHQPSLINARLGHYQFRDYPPCCHRRPSRLYPSLVPPAIIDRCADATDSPGENNLSRNISTAVPTKQTGF